MAGRKGSVERLLWDEFETIRPSERPRYGTIELDNWIKCFMLRHNKHVDLSDALYTLKYLIPGYND